MKKIYLKVSLIVLSSILIFVSCKKNEVTPTTNNSGSGATFTWNGTTYNTSSGSGSSFGQTFSEKACGYYFIFSYILNTQGSNGTTGSYIYLYLPSNGSTGTYNIVNYAGTASGTALSNNEAWLYVYNSTISGGNTIYDYGYATSGTISVQKDGDNVKATFDNINTYSASSSNGAASKGILSGSVTSTSLTYDFSSYNCNTTTSGNNTPPDNTTTTGTDTNTDENPVVGTVSFVGVDFPVFKDDYTYFSYNNSVSASATATTVSGGNTITGLFYISFKSSGTSVAGDYNIVNYSSSEIEAGQATYYAIASDQAYNIYLGYAVSGKITVTVTDGKTTVSLVNVDMNTSADGTGTDLGSGVGSLTQ